MKVVLDGRRVSDRKALHQVLEEALRLPEWYGRNLDALHDCLTERREDVEIEICHQKALKAALGGYGEAFLRLLRDAAMENPHIRLKIDT